MIDFLNKYFEFEVVEHIMNDTIIYGHLIIHIGSQLMVTLS